MTLNELTDYYTSLLIYQYRGLPNAARQVRLLAKQSVADYLAGQLLSCFDLDTAVGAQLDILGQYIGLSRNVGIAQPRPFFSLWDYASSFDPTLYQGTWVPDTDTPSLPSASGHTGEWYVAASTGVSTSPIAASFLAGDIIYSDGATWIKESTDCGNGLTDYTDYAINQAGIFYNYLFATGQNSDLTDSQYRAALKLKIVLNSSNGSLASIVSMLVQFFPGGEIRVTDNKDMTLTYVVFTTLGLSTELLEIFLPRPMGVMLNIVLVTPTPPGESETLTTEDGLILTTEDGTTLVTETTT